MQVLFGLLQLDEFFFNLSAQFGKIDEARVRFSSR
jgi:hypothetical protein